MFQRIVFLLVIGWIMKLDTVRPLDWGALVPEWLLHAPTHAPVAAAGNPAASTFHYV